MRHALRCQDVWKRVSMRDAIVAIVIERSGRTPLTECAAELRGADVCRADHRRTRISITELLAGTRSVVILVKMFPNRIDMEAVVQLPSCADARRPQVAAVHAPVGYRIEIGRAQCRGRGCKYVEICVVERSSKKK